MGRLALGVDLGGSKIAYALIDEAGQVIQRLKEPTTVEEGPTKIIERLAIRIQHMLNDAPGKVRGIGIGVAGMTDSQKGMILLASNLHWKDVPLRQMLVDRLGQCWEGLIWIDKDTNAAALGEMYYGEAKGCHHLLYVSVGTGIGGGIVIAGQLYHGASEGAGDIGHLVLKPDGPICGCGKQGCLETLASGPAISRSICEALSQGIPSSLQTMDQNQITAQSVIEAASLGDVLSTKTLSNAGRWLSIALAYYIDINNPELIIIGGGVGQAGDLLIKPVREMIKINTLPRNGQAVSIRQAGLQVDSGVIGAGTLVFHNKRNLQ